MSTIFIGIAGGTGSGKTTLTRHLKEHFGDAVTVIGHDSYYKRQDGKTYEERSKVNYDHPDAFETSLLVEHLKALKAGRSIQCPVYSYVDHNRTDETVEVFPTKVIIVEGILIFQDPTLRDMFDIKIFVETDADVRILRRALRDIRDRGRTLESVITQYLTTVKPMHEQYVEPSRKYADIIVLEGGHNLVALDMIMSASPATSRARTEQGTQQKKQPAGCFFFLHLRARKAEHHAHEGGEADEHDGVPVLRLPDPAREHEQHGGKDGPLPEEHAASEPEGLAHDDKARRRDERGGRGTQAVERTRDVLTVAERLQESRDDEDHNDARRNEADGRRHRAGHAPGQEADVGRHVDADGAGGGLGHGDHVRELRAGEPAGLIRHIVEERKRGHAAADGEKAGLEKFPEEL